MQHNITAQDYIKSGNAHCIKKKFDLAITDFTHAIELDPNWFQGYCSRGNAYCAQRRLDLAISDHIKAIKRAPNDANTYHCCGIAYYAKQKFDLAIADCTKAIEIDPNYFQEFLNLFIVSKALKKPILFGIIKILPPIQQIQLLKQCLDINTVLGQKFFEPEEWYEIVYGCNIKSGMLLEINKHLSGLERLTVLWTFLQGPELVRNRKLNMDTFLLITSYFLQVDFFTTDQFKSRIQKFQLTMFQPNTRKRKREEVDLDEPESRSKCKKI